MIACSEDSFFWYATEVFHGFVPDNNPVLLVDCKCGIRQVIDDISHALLRFLEICLSTSPFDRESDLVFEFHELGGGIASFLEVKIRSAGEGVYNHFLPSFAGKEDERNPVAICSDLFEKLDAIHSRHLVIGDNAVELRSSHHLKRLGSGCCGVHAERSRPLEEHLSHVEKNRFVIHIQGREHSQCPYDDLIYIYIKCRRETTADRCRVSEPAPTPP